MLVGERPRKEAERGGGNGRGPPLGGGDMPGLQPPEGGGTPLQVPGSHERLPFGEGSQVEAREAYLS